MSLKSIDNAIYYALLLYALASSISIAAANTGIALALLFGIIRYKKEPFSLEIDKRLLQVLALFWLVCLVSAVFAYNKPLGLEKTWAYVWRTVPLFLAAYFVRTKQQLTTILVVMAVSLLIADGYTIWQWIKGGTRVKAFSSNAMILAGYLLQMIPLLMVFALESRDFSRRTRMVLLTIVLISLGALVFNGTRGAWLGVIVAFVSYVMLRLRTKTSLALCLAVLIAVGVIGLGTVPTIKNRAASITQMTSNSERLLLWQGSWQMFLDHPILGVGTSSFQEVYLASYISPEAKHRLGAAHNNFFHILAENGVLGLITFVTMFNYILFYLYRHGVRGNNPVALGVLLATISLLVQGLTEFNYGDSAVIRMFWFILGLAVASSRVGVGVGLKDSA